MANLLNSVSVALSALTSHQQAIQVIEHNVANVNTEGYHRQSAVLSASQAVTLSNSYYGTGVGQMGTGVTVTEIERFTVSFYDTRYRTSIAETSKWSTESDIISQLEATMGETTDDSLLTKIDSFFSSWQSVIDNPTDLSVRRQLLDDAKSLANAINLRAESIQSLRSEQDLAIQQDVDEINQLTSEIADLNREISRVYSVGDSPNDLLDERDLALDRLAELCGAKSYAQDNGEVMVSVGGHILVSGEENYELSTEMDTTNDNLLKVVWSDGKDFTPSTGELAGIIEARDTVITEQQTGLEELTSTLMTSINALHETGYGLDGTTDEAFFVGTDALSIDVNSVLDDVEKIAVSSAEDESGNTDIAQQIYDLYSTKIMTSNTATFSNFYNDLVANLGLSVSNAESNASSQELVSDALSTQRESVSGVSLNEEAANLVQVQKAYEAAARVMTVIDEMLDTLINQMAA